MELRPGTSEKAIFMPIMFRRACLGSVFPEVFPPLFVFIFFFVAGCASLPKLEEIPTPHESPTVIGPRGVLPPEKQEALLAQLDHKVETALLRKHVALVESIGGSPLVTGNKVTLLIDAPATYQAMIKAIRQARDHINLEVYLFADDEIGRTFADLLREKQGAGVQVNLLYDSLGSRRVPPSFFEELRRSGIQALEFNPIDPAKARRTWLLTRRDHRKILVVDGKAAFTGGINIAEIYSESSSGRLLGPKTKMPWRDTHVQIEGPAAAEFQKLFLDAWAEQHGPNLPARNYFPPLKKRGDDLVQVIANRPGEKKPAIYLMYLSAISRAEKSVHLTNPYFVPDKQMVKALKEAAGRGVDVKIILPGSSDSGVIFFAGRSFYTELLRAGVRLYERKGAMLHAKTAVVDGVWSTIGSTNLELWSFTRNYEVNTIILQEDFAAQMEELFARDAADSKEVHLEEWEKRPLKERIKEWFVRRVRRWL